MQSGRENPAGIFVSSEAHAPSKLADSTPIAVSRLAPANRASRKLASVIVAAVKSAFARIVLSKTDPVRSADVRTASDRVAAEKSLL